VKIGILCPANIARQRFMPALRKCADIFEYAGVAFATKDEVFDGSLNDEALTAQKAAAIQFNQDIGDGGEIFEGFMAMLQSDIDCVYIPLPPSLHHYWGMQALKAGKHILMEKPFTTTLADTCELLEFAKASSLAVHENYAFRFHSQLTFIQDLVQSGTIGDVRMMRIDFGFPFRGSEDFRYHKASGGGALLDCGGYTLNLATALLGENAQLIQSSLSTADNFDVDIFGNAVMTNDEGQIAQLSFGMDNDYRCSLDIWGSKGSIFTDRIFTAPFDFEPDIYVKQGKTTKTHKLPPDDAFQKTIRYFYQAIVCDEIKRQSRQRILTQAKLIERCFEYANN